MKTYQGQRSDGARILCCLLYQQYIHAPADCVADSHVYRSLNWPNWLILLHIHHVHCHVFIDNIDEYICFEI
jgi:hypothetical protein